MLVYVRMDILLRAWTLELTLPVKPMQAVLVSGSTFKSSYNVIPTRRKPLQVKRLEEKIKFKIMRPD